MRMRLFSAFVSRYCRWAGTYVSTAQVGKTVFLFVFVINAHTQTHYKYNTCRYVCTRVLWHTYEYGFCIHIAVYKRRRRRFCRRRRRRCT